MEQWDSCASKYEGVVTKIGERTAGFIPAVTLNSGHSNRPWPTNQDRFFGDHLAARQVDRLTNVTGSLWSKKAPVPCPQGFQESQARTSAWV
jgi:hypothetical protein